MRKCVYIFLFMLLCIRITAQSDTCKYSLSGKIICTKLNEELGFATIYIKELNKGVSANEQSHFYIDGLCKGNYTIRIAYVGHNDLDTIIKITRNTSVVFNLIPTNSLKEVTVEGHQIKKQEVETLQKDEISGVEIEKTRGLSLGEALKAIVGVNSLQTGPGISKPMIHGLYGNRVLLLNNGVRLEGQNWGADHAPEIDPFIATKLSVIKGAASIRYGMNAIAGVVLVDPKDMPHTKCLNGEINLVGATNGRSGTGSGFLEGAFGKKLSGLSWRTQGTFRKAGNFSTPTYYLPNSGIQERNYSGAFSYKKQKFGIDGFFSDFNTTIGISWTSIIGNLQDLEAAAARPTPLWPSYFTYNIARGYQQVDHKTAKGKGFYKFNKAGKLEYIYAWQQNRRSEYGDEVPLGNLLGNTPDAYFQLTTTTHELIWEHPAIKNISGSIGSSFITQGNIYQGLDFRALIPNYRNYGGGLFILEKWNKRKLTIEAGARYDYLWMQTYTEDFSTLTKHSSEYSWANYSATLGGVYRFNEYFSLNTSLGIGWRPPAPIEMFANGIHQSAASYEKGDTTLKAERSYNAQTYFNFSSKKIVAEIGGYYNLINNYIYLRPEYPKVITTSVGTFPLFQYTAANVYLTGVDANINYKLFNWLTINSKTTYLYAYNRTIHNYLIYAPANRYENGFTISKTSLGKLKQLYLSTSALVVSKQTHVPPNEDYLPPPAGYWLLNADLGFSIPIKQQLININFMASNILNTIYRDYLDRFRYFNNALGRNFTLRLKIPFSVFSKKPDV